MSVWERAMGEADVRVKLPGGEPLFFRRIPACPEGFLMGSRGYDADEEPRHRVVIGHEFYLGTFVVTNVQYRVMAEQAVERFLAIDGMEGIDPGGDGGGRWPVEYVKWEEADAVCQWLSGSGLLEAAGLPVGWRARLPTEAEWEYACRGGTDTEYYSGDGEAALESVGWYSGNSGDARHSVDERPERHPFGLYGMHGNIGEWCADVWRYKAYQSRTDPWIDTLETAVTGHGGDDVRSSGEKPIRVARGGSAKFGARDCRSAARLRDRMGVRSSGYSFRICLAPG